MELSFVPRRLQSVRNEIHAIHKNKNEIIDVPCSSGDQELEHLIRSLVGLNEVDLAIEAQALMDQDICRIAGYLPYNYFHVDMKNLFCIFLTRSDTRLCAILYRQWQNSYDNESCNYFLHILLNRDNYFETYIREKHIKPERMDDIIQNHDIVIGMGLEIMNYPFTEKKTLAEKFNFLGIGKDSRLYKDCANAFYTFCRKEDYLEANKIELLDIVKKYEVRNQPLLKGFLINFLNKLKLGELAGFRDLARYFESLVRDARKPKIKYAFLFEGMREDLIEKYMDWLNRCKIEQYFENDERSEFWKQYRFVDVQKFAKSNAVVMSFKEYVAVEFLGQAMGPIYFYPKEYFDKKLKIQFMFLENAPLRQYLLHQSQYEKEDRKEHRGYWQYNVNAYIMKHHVTRKIFE